jgi:hypothetical protein
MNIKDPEYIEIRNKILKGIELGVQNLIKERKKTDGELVVFQNGKVVHLKAKDL